MVPPTHIGLEHPQLLWLVVVGLLAFVAGLGVNLYRSTDDPMPDRDPTPGEDR